MTNVAVYDLTDIRNILKEFFNTDYSLYDICCAVFPKCDDRILEAITQGKLNTMIDFEKNEDKATILLHILDCIKENKLQSSFIICVVDYSKCLRRSLYFGCCVLRCLFGQRYLRLSQLAENESATERKPITSARFFVEMQLFLWYNQFIN